MLQQQVQFVVSGKASGQKELKNCINKIYYSLFSLLSIAGT
jgi:hypothetical protein